jgi:hypothetical protein
MDNKNKCPHCESQLQPVKTPPLSSWGGEIIYVCFNDACPYYLHSWDVIASQCGHSLGYRYRLDSNGNGGAELVQNAYTFLDLITTEEELENEAAIKKPKVLTLDERITNLENKLDYIIEKITKGD